MAPLGPQSTEPVSELAAEDLQNEKPLSLPKRAEGP